MKQFLRKVPANESRCLEVRLGALVWRGGEGRGDVSSVLTTEAMLGFVYWVGADMGRFFLTPSRSPNPAFLTHRPAL